MNKNRKILAGIAILAIAGIATFNVSLNSQNRKVGGISLANVKALASGEDGTSVGTCYLTTNSGTVSEWKVFCDSRTSSTTIYPCPTQTTYGNFLPLAQDRCTK
jgi:hypothetical protein